MQGFEGVEPLVYAALTRVRPAHILSLPLTYISLLDSGAGGGR